MGAVQKLATVVIVGLVALSTLLVVYLADENNRMSAEVQEKDEVAVERGIKTFIANCMVYGDNRLFNIALVVPDFSNLKTWAKDHGVDAASDEKLIEDGKVKVQIQAEVDKLCADFKGFEEIKKVVLLPEDFTTENGMMTPSMKVKRRVVVQKYADKIEAAYQ